MNVAACCIYCSIESFLKKRFEAEPQKPSRSCMNIARMKRLVMSVISTTYNFHRAKLMFYQTDNKGPRRRLTSFSASLIVITTEAQVHLSGWRQFPIDSGSSNYCTFVQTSISHGFDETLGPVGFGFCCSACVLTSNAASS